MIKNFLKSIGNKIRQARREKEKKREWAASENPFKRVKRRYKIKQSFKPFFREVRIIKCLDSRDDVLVQCSGIYYNPANQKHVCGYNHRFETEMDKAYTIYHFLFACLHCNYGAMLHDPFQYGDGFLFRVYCAYLERESNASPRFRIASASVAFVASACKNRAQKGINGKSLKACLALAKKARKFIAESMRIYYLRSVKYAVFQDIRPYESSVRNLKVCKYFKCAGTADIGKDILEIQFRIIGISSECQSCLKDLSPLLEQMLRDFYTERLGFQIPYIYVTLLQEGELRIWAAKNKYGDELIQKRSCEDEWKDAPNMEDLEDD